MDYLKKWLRKYHEYLHGSNVNFILLACSVILGFTPLRLIGFGILVYVLARTLPSPFGLIGKIVVSYLVLSSILACLAATAWLTNTHLTSGFIICLSSVVLMAIIFFTQRSGHVQTKARLFDKDDLLASLVSALALALLLITLQPRPNAINLATVTIAGGDNSSHIQMIKANDYNGSLSIGKTNKYNLAPNLYAYPQGWHFNGAVTKWLMEAAVPISPHAGRILAFFYMFSALWFILLVFLVVRLALQLLDKITVKKRSKQREWYKLATLIVSIVGIVGWLLPLLSSGFQPQIAALCLLLVEASLLITTYDKPLSQRYKYLLLAAIPLIGVSFMWVFLVPIGALMLIICTIQILLKLKKLPLYFIGGAVVAALATGFQMYVQFSNPASGGGISARGFVPMLALYPLVGLMAVLTLYMYLRKTSQSFRIIYSFGIVSFIFTVALMVYQLQSLGEVRYYYYKSIYTIIVFVIILLAAVGGEIAQHVYNMKPVVNLPKKVHSLIFVLTLVFIGSIGFSVYKSTQFDQYYHRKIQGITPDQASSLMDLLALDPLNGQRYVPLGACDRGEDIRAVLLANALAYTPKNFTEQAVVVELTSQDPQLIFWQMDIFLHKTKSELYVVSRDQSLNPQLLSYFETHNPGALKRIHIKDIDPDPLGTVRAFCPDRLGR